MTFVTKLMISAITIGFTVFGGIWTGFEKIDGRMDKKVSKGKKEVATLVIGMRRERDILFKAQDEKIAVQMVAIRNEVSETRKDVRELLRITRESQVFRQNRIKNSYTIRENGNKGNRL